MLKFSEMPLIAPLLENLEAMGHEVPTAIQAQAIPLILEGHDLLGISQTGTGKTAAFCLPILQKIKNTSESHGVRALILAPTRELASQIQLSFETYGKDLGIKSLAVFGGIEQSQQVKTLKAGVEIIIATPGRLLDLMGQKHIRLGKIEMLVLDEADRMLDMGFVEDLQEIIQAIPKTRQTMFFSATMPEPVVDLSRRILKSPKRVEVTSNSSTVEKIKQRVIFCTREDKFQLLKKILKQDERELVIVFTKTKNTADKVKEYLRSHKIAATVFHGDKSQEERERALSNFVNKSLKVLIATDIAARGIDVQDVSHVINFELPLEAENYVHRIGRTARAGKEGVAITFCEDSERETLDRIETLIQIRLPTENFKGVREASGIWNQEGAIKTTKAPTPGKSQEKTAYLDNSKRQRVVPEGAKPKPHPGFRKTKKKR
jgi:ATP-dependent RNA helicase RhlE